MTMQSGVFKKYDPLEKWGKYTAAKVAKLPLKNSNYITLPNHRG